MPLDNSTQATLPGDFPNELIEHWRLYGFGGYGEGLIWTHPPTHFEGVIEEWTGLTLREAVLVARFSFGDFMMWAQGNIYFVNVHVGWIEELPETPRFIFDEILIDDKFLDHFLRRSLHEECMRRLGSVSTRECFAFVPSLAFGGMESVEYVQRVAIREQLALLAQLNGPVALP